MSRSEEQLQIARSIWNESWAFYKKYHGCPGDSETWEEIVKDFEEITKKNHSKPVCIRVMLAALMLLEEETR